MCEFSEGGELFRIVQLFWQRKVWTQRHLRGEKLRCKVLARKSAKFVANFSVLARNFSATKVTSLPSICLSLSLCISLSLSYRANLTHKIGSASALPIIQRERERRKWRHHCRAKIGDEFTLSLAQNSHDELTLCLAKLRTFRFSLYNSASLPSRRGHHCGAEIRNEFTFSIAKIFFTLFVPPLSNGTSRATSDRKPKTNDQILPRPILFFPSKKAIKLIPKTIGIRKRDCAWGGSGW